MDCPKKLEQLCYYSTLKSLLIYFNYKFVILRSYAWILIRVVLFDEILIYKICYSSLQQHS